MNSKNLKQTNKIKEFCILIFWNLMFFLALNAVVGSQYNVAGVYGLL